jgi:hypothetical protein
LNSHKHIFYSHSWLTQLIIEAYINSRKIEIGDVVILSNRQFDLHVNPLLKTKFINARKILFPNVLHALMAGNKLNRYLQWIERISEGKTYSLYLPHFHPIGIKVLAKHKNCRKLYLIEEGELSYFNASKINSRHNYRKLKKRYLNFFWQRGVKNALALQTVDFNLVEGTLQLFKEAFPESKNKMILRDEVRNVIDQLDWGIDSYNNVLVLTPYVDVLDMNLELYMERLEAALSYILGQTFEVLHYKFHPSDSEIVRARTTELMMKLSDRFKPIEDRISLEAILFKKKPKVYSFLSSVSLYAYLLKCDLVILSDFIIPVESNFQEVNGTSLEPYYIKKQFD